MNSKTQRMNIGIASTIPKQVEAQIIPIKMLEIAEIRTGAPMPDDKTSRQKSKTVKRKKAAKPRRR